MDPSRLDYWRKKLSPLLIGVEPVEVQLRRRFAGMVVISALTILIGGIILAILAGFGRPDIGLRIMGVVFAPATAWFWLDYALLRRRALAYARERGAIHDVGTPPDRT